MKWVLAVILFFGVPLSTATAATFDFEGTVQLLNDGRNNPLSNIGPFAMGDAVTGTISFDESAFAGNGAEGLCSPTSTCTRYFGLISSFDLTIAGLTFSMLDPSLSEIVLEDQSGLGPRFEDYAIFSSSTVIGTDNADGPMVDGLDPTRVQFGVAGSGDLLADETGISLLGLRDLLAQGSVSGGLSFLEFSDNSDVRFSVTSVTPQNDPTPSPVPVPAGLPMLLLAVLLLPAFRMRGSMNTPLSIGAGVAALVLMCAPAASRADTHVASVQSRLVQSGAAWPSPVIPVCWESKVDRGNFTPRTRALVENALNDSWEAASNVDFVGWGPCPQPAYDLSGRKTFSGVRVRSKDGRPRARSLGASLAGIPNGIELNFDFESWGSNLSRCVDSVAGRDFCIRTYAVHEFGHALGFAHEHNRDDRGSCEMEPQGTAAMTFLTRYDPNSVMSYCIFNDVLSTLDKEGVRLVYGPPLPDKPTIIHIEGSNFIVDHEFWEANETGGEHFVRTLPLGTGSRSTTISTCVGNEVRLEALLTGQYPPSASVPQLNVIAKLFEGASGNCWTTSELEDEDRGIFPIRRNEVAQIRFRLKNENVEGDDEGTLNLNVRELWPAGVVRVSSGLCLDVHAPDLGRNGARVQVWTCLGQTQQRWTFVPWEDGSGWGSFVNRFGQCLDVNKPDLRTNGGKVQVWECNGDDQQAWRLNGDQIRNKAGRCLDVHRPDLSKDGGLVQIWECNGSPQQRWIEVSQIES